LGNEYLRYKAYQKENQQTFEYKPEQAAGGFEKYINSKGAPQGWIDIQWE